VSCFSWYVHILFLNGEANHRMFCALLDLSIVPVLLLTE